MKKTNFIILSLFTVLLLIFGFSTGVSKASASNLGGPIIQESTNENTSILENDTSILENDTSILENDTSILENDTSILENDTSILENDTSTVQPTCLTCGGTITKDYTILSTERTYGYWRDANLPEVSGGPNGGSKTFTHSKTYSVEIAGSGGYEWSSMFATLGFSLGYSEEFIVSQTFNLEKNKKYKVYERPNYLVYNVRFSVYDMQIGGRQTFKEYRYTTIKKPLGNQLDLFELKN